MMKARRNQGVNYPVKILLLFNHLKTMRVEVCDTKTKLLAILRSTNKYGNVTTPVGALDLFPLKSDDDHRRKKNKGKTAVGLAPLGLHLCITYINTTMIITKKHHKTFSFSCFPCFFVCPSGYFGGDAICDEGAIVLRALGLYFGFIVFFSRLILYITACFFQMSFTVMSCIYYCLHTVFIFCSGKIHARFFFFALRFI